MSVQCKKKTPWTSGEDQALEEGVVKYGYNWQAIKEKYGSRGNKRLERREKGMTIRDRAYTIRCQRLRQGSSLGVFRDVISGKPDPQINRSRIQNEEEVVIATGSAVSDLSFSETPVLKNERTGERISMSLDEFAAVRHFLTGFRAAKAMNEDKCDDRVEEKKEGDTLQSNLCIPDDIYRLVFLCIEKSCEFSNFARVSRQTYVISREGNIQIYLWCLMRNEYSLEVLLKHRGLPLGFREFITTTKCTARSTTPYVELGYWNEMDYAQIDLDVLEGNEAKVNWKKASMTMKLSNEIVERFEQYIRWVVISERNDLPLEFVNEHQHKLDWQEISCNEANHTVEFLGAFKENICWWTISRLMKISEEMIDTFKDHLDWQVLSRRLCKNLLRKYAGRVVWDNVWRWQDGLDEDFIVEFRGHGDWRSLVPRHHQLSKSFIQQYCDELDWSEISKFQNPNDFLSIRNARRIDWFCLAWFQPRVCAKVYPRMKRFMWERVTLLGPRNNADEMNFWDFREASVNILTEEGVIFFFEDLQEP